MLVNKHTKQAPLIESTTEQLNKVRSVIIIIFLFCFEQIVVKFLDCFYPSY